MGIVITVIDVLALLICIYGAVKAFDKNSLEELCLYVCFISVIALTLSIIFASYLS